MRCLHFPGIALAIVLSAAVTVAQQPLSDLEPGVAGSDPRDFLSIGEAVLFVAETSAHGREVWRTDGTAAGTTVVDLAPGTASSVIGPLARIGDSAVFVSLTPTPGLYRTDGTAAGTVQIFPLGLVGPDSFVTVTSVDLKTSSGRILIGVSDGPLGKQMLATDGTANGTEQLVPGPGVDAVVTRDGVGYLMLQQPARLWQTDGTVSGTSQVWSRAGVVASLGRGAPEDNVYWGVFDSTNRTAEVMAIDVGATNARLVWQVSNVPEGAGVRHFGSRALFVPRDFSNAALPSQLWVTDGTPGGANLLTSQLARGLSLTPFTIGDRQLFVRSSGTLSIPFFAVWETDGTVAGTQLVWPPFLIRSLEISKVGDNRVFFTAPLGLPGVEPSIYDGQTVSTFADLAAGPGDSHAEEFTLADGLAIGPSVVFRATRAAIGSEPWIVPLATVGAADFVETRRDGCSIGGAIPSIDSVGGLPSAGNAEFGLRLSAPAHAGRLAAFVFGIELAAAVPGSPCSLPLLDPFVAAGMTDGLGELSLSIPVSNDPAIVGLRVFTTGIVASPGGALAGVADRSSVFAILVGS